MTPADLSRLETLAREATPGEWETPADKPWRVYSGDVLIAVASGMTHPSDQVYADANAAYIAAANPDAVLALIERVRELEGDAVRFAWIANHGVPIMPGAPGIYPTCGKGPAVLRRAVDAAMKPGC